MMMLATVTYSFAEIVFLVFLNIVQQQYGGVYVENRIRAAIMKTLSPSVVIKLLVIIVICGHFTNVVKRTGLNLHKAWRFVPKSPHLIYQVTWQDKRLLNYTLSEAWSWSGVNWADLMAAQGAFGTDFYDRSIRTIVGTMLWMEYRPVKKIGPKGALHGQLWDPPNSLRSKPRTEYRNARN